MARQPPAYSRYLPTDNGQLGFSSIAAGFWRVAEKLRDDAVKETAGQSWPAHWSVPSIICLYHASLDCFINEEILLQGILIRTAADRGYQIQGNTLCEKKLNDFFSHFGKQQTPEVQRRSLLLVGLRNRLAHHWPEMKDIRDYPVKVIDALNDAGIERVNASWTAQCSDVRVAKWGAEVVRAFVDDWWRIGRLPGKVERLSWEFGPKWVYPSDDPAASKS
jgi:hypothetical protein